ncbi:TlpA family protein disulfide reductase [Chryseobacterium sp.]|uniref:TlpA family protein disulfide reductase n=1 Tax=Chryseobacterium sp. TaxID=1871047 RepID=UPI0012A88642|nr:TlpA family protein disulfide reductase [Chryseobacterium sp.]QFG53176.1 redoxin domain-containing protein [Chryseobacterium sp.]
MKKLVVMVVLAVSVSSCNKKEPVADNIDYSEDSITVPETNEPALIYNPVEYSPAQISDFLAEKDNDTLYVTNFFATWCAPCMREMPHFKEKMQELKGQPVKFTFVSLDQKTDWPTDVKNFAEVNGLTENVVLLDGSLLQEDFFSSNFKNWDGSGIPFTFMRKRGQTDEYMSMMTKEQLDTKINSFK